MRAKPKEGYHMDRQRQIELMESAEQRTAGYVRKWLEESPELKALLHRRDSDKPAGHRVVKKARVAAR